ncbi:MAG: hypothetical protein GX369_04370 [Euryarchaeota archaeon]|nr:hypothetical protein [Euryarchaeota archaeon]
MASYKTIGLILLSMGIVSIIFSIFSTTLGSSSIAPNDIILRLVTVVGLSFLGTVLLSLGVTFLLIVDKSGDSY